MSRDGEFLQAVKDGMRPTGLDRAISKWFPGWGRRRLEARATMAVAGAWSGASHSSPEMRRFNPSVESVEDEQIYDRETLLARATHLERNDAVAGGAIDELLTSVVGTGLSLQCEPNRSILGWTEDQAAEWARDVQDRFALWAQNPSECDLRRKANFYKLQALAYKTRISRGDTFAILPRKRYPGRVWSLKVQLVEGDRCLTPRGKRDEGRLSQGIEVDDVGAVVRYHFSKKHPSCGTLTEADFMSIPAFDAEGRPKVLHLYQEDRLDLRRGYPLLSPVISTLKQLSRLTESELAAAVVSSFFAVVIKRNGTAAGGGPFGSLPAKKAQGLMELGPAMIGELQPGEDLVNVSPTRPNGAYDPFWRSLVGQISLRVQVPPEVLLKKFESSYTAARGALLKFWKFVVVVREDLAAQFCQPVFEAWLEEDVALGNTRAPGFLRNPLLRAAYCNARWVGDNPPILDPLKEVQAAEKLLALGLTTHTEQTTRLTGGDFDANQERLVREMRIRREAGLLPTQAAPSADPVPDPIDPAAPGQEDA